MPIEYVKKEVEKFKSLRVAVIGEIIVDEYVYGEALGKSSREPIIALEKLDSVMHLGGSAAIANHVANFSDDVLLESFCLPIVLTV